MRSHPFLTIALVVAATVASGTLECSHTGLTPVQTEGAKLYGRMCSVCHGNAGEGYRADQAPALGHPGFLASVNDYFLRTAIADGRTGTTMSAWSTDHGGPLSQRDIETVVMFIHTFHRGPRAKLNDHPVSGSASSGSQIFARECARCHGERGTGGPNVGIGNAALLSAATNGFLRHAIQNGRAPTPMPGFGASLGERGIDDVIAHLRSLQAAAAPPPPAAPTPPPPIPLGPVPLNPKGPAPIGFRMWPATTPADVVHRELERGARFALLDARAPPDYRNEHIAGAVSVPFYDPAPYLDDLPKNAWLVCYCACPHAESGQLAQRLTASGFTKVTVLDEGLGVWKAREYGTHTGADP
jgi:cytochrome c oxidase cbb3-type subunit 3